MRFCRVHQEDAEDDENIPVILCLFTSFVHFYDEFVLSWNDSSLTFKSNLLLIILLTLLRTAFLRTLPRLHSFEFLPLDYIDYCIGLTSSHSRLKIIVIIWRYLHHQVVLNCSNISSFVFLYIINLFVYIFSGIDQPAMFASIKIIIILKCNMSGV